MIQILVRVGTEQRTSTCGINLSRNGSKNHGFIHKHQHVSPYNMFEGQHFLLERKLTNHKSEPLLADATRNGLELVRSVSDKHLDLLRFSTRYISVVKGQVSDAVGREKGKYTLIRDLEDSQLGIYDKPLPCFGCGIGWFSFLLGFVFPLLWYYGTILYFGNYYRRDPRERAGLAASAIAALACTIALLIIAAIIFF